jgi:hypothetical protein
LKTHSLFHNNVSLKGKNKNILNQSSTTKCDRFLTITAMDLVTLKVGAFVQQTSLRGRFVEKNSCLVAALGVAKFITIIAMFLVTLFCPT